jgi:hypothetical protein
MRLAPRASEYSRSTMAIRGVGSLITENPYGLGLNREKTIDQYLNVMETVVYATKITHIIHIDSVRGPVRRSDVGTHWTAGAHAESDTK